MDHLKYIIFLIACCITVCICNKKREDKTFLRKERSSFGQLKERIINGISRMHRYDVHGWVNVQKISDDSLKKIDLILRDGKVICMNSNNVVPVKALSYKIKHEDSKNIYSEYFFEYVGMNNNNNNKELLNPIPVMIPKEPGRHIISQNKVLPDNFEGYLVCEQKGSPASLIHHTIETLEFTTPPWRSLVDIQLYRNPLAPYGRLYKIIVLDNVEVLKNGKKSFFWPLPVSSMADVYAFQTAIEDSRKGIYCMLSRDFVSFNIKLSCRSWKRSLTNAVVNGFMFLGLLIMNSCFGANLFFLKHKPLFTKTISLANGDTTVLYQKEEILRFAEEEGEEVADEEEEAENSDQDEEIVGSLTETSSVNNYNLILDDSTESVSSSVKVDEESEEGGKHESNNQLEASGKKSQKNVSKKSKGELALEKFDKYYPYKEEDKKKTKQMLFFGNLIYLIGWGVLNGGWGITALIKISSVLRRADNELKKAKLSNPWTLEYPNINEVKPKNVEKHTQGVQGKTKVVEKKKTSLH